MGLSHKCMDMIPRKCKVDEGIVGAPRDGTPRQLNDYTEGQIGKSCSFKRHPFSGPVDSALKLGPKSLSKQLGKMTA